MTPGTPMPRYRVTGFSLLPVVPPGASIDVRPAGPGGPLPGDLAVVRLAGRPRCHVVVSSAAGIVVTRGIWAGRDDPPASGPDVVGVVDAVRISGLRFPTASPAFRAWLALGRRCGPAIRRFRDTVWVALPEDVRARLRVAVGRRSP